MNWISTQKEGALIKRNFAVTANGRTVPGVIWTREGDEGPRPLVLVGHGGSQHKEDSGVTDIAYPLVGEAGFAVAAIDGPVHGDRRLSGSVSPGQVIQDFRKLWVDNPSMEEMAQDWSATIDFLAALPEIKADAIGWFGISMGTAYGLPVCATDKRIRAALLGMWGTSHAHGARLVEIAQKVSCPVLFHRKTEDERFTQEGQRALYDAIGSEEKQFHDYPGLHINPQGAQLDDALHFLIAKLS